MHACTRADLTTSHLCSCQDMLLNTHWVVLLTSCMLNFNQFSSVRQAAAPREFAQACHYNGRVLC